MRFKLDLPKGGMLVVAIVSLVAILAFAVTALLQSQAKDTRLYAYNPNTKERVSAKQLVFLYAVDSATGKVKTYSPVLGDVWSGSTAITQDTVEVDSDATTTAAVAKVNIVGLEASQAQPQGALPFVEWTDMQGRYQRQYFVQGKHACRFAATSIAHFFSRPPLAPPSVRSLSTPNMERRTFLVSALPIGRGW